jgi:hypothetical protein
MATSQIDTKQQVIAPPPVVTEEDIRRRQAELLDIQIAEAKEAREKKVNDARMAAEAKRQGAEQHLKKIQLQQAVQQFCRHVRHDGKPFVDAIKLPGGRMLATCANEQCGKEWLGSVSEVRNNPELRGLFPPDDQIGGITE